jgi:hypothetical protein
MELPFHTPRDEAERAGFEHLVRVVDQARLSQAG